MHLNHDQTYKINSYHNYVRMLIFHLVQLLYTALQCFIHALDKHVMALATQNSIRPSVYIDTNKTGAVTYMQYMV